VTAHLREALRFPSWARWRRPVAESEEREAAACYLRRALALLEQRRDADARLAIGAAEGWLALAAKASGTSPAPLIRRERRSPVGTP